MFFCIPSYKRSKICNARTLKTLRNLGVPKENVYVFIVREDIDDYNRDIDRSLCGEIIVGVKGLVQQRQYISDFFTEGTRLVFLDDDIYSLDLSMTPFDIAMEFFESAFETCEKESAYIWGIYPVFNEYFRKDRKPVTTDISYIVGAFYGIINRHSEDLKLTICTDGNKEDVERSIRYYLKDGKTIRFNKIGFETKYYGTDGGGLGKFKDRLQSMKKYAIKLNEEFPDLTRIKIRNNGMYEISLRPHPPKNSRKKQNNSPESDDETIPELIPVNPDEPVFLPEFIDTEKILRLLKQRVIPCCDKGKGRSGSFGRHRSMTLGMIKARVSRKYELSYYSKQRPELYEEVVRIGKLICPFEFNAIHINHNVECPRHIDGNNAGKSVIISFGDYEGGSLHIENFGEFVTKNRPLIFDGGKHYHWNTPITSGNKYSLVYFTSANV